MTDAPARLRARELSARVEARRTILHALHQRADIVDQIERLCSPMRMPDDVDAPIGSEKWRRKRELEARWEDEDFVRKLRRLYSAVPDPGLRRELIEASQQLDAARQAEAYAWVGEAVDDLAQAQRPSRWWLAAPAFSFGLVYLVYDGVGPFGTLGGVLAALALTASIRTNALAERRSRIRAAEDALKDAEKTAQQRGERGYVFSAAEAETGELVSSVRAST